MKLFYFKQSHGIPNFGDDLNAWLWPQLLPGIFDEQDDVIFVGIGTVLNERIPKARRTIVFSSGVGYGQLPEIDATWTIYCVRGPISANALGLPAKKAVSDGGILVNRLFKGGSESKYAVSYMPHSYLSDFAPWQSVCDELGINFISPQQPVKETLLSISESSLLITEAMHGAIVADALRVPWVPVVTNPKVLSSKWDDWCKSMDLKYTPTSLATLWDVGNKGLLAKTRLSFKKAIVKKTLRRIIDNGQGTLSDPAVLEEKCTELEKRIEIFRKDIKLGRFS